MWQLIQRTVRVDSVDLLSDSSLTILRKHRHIGKRPSFLLLELLQLGSIAQHSFGKIVVLANDKDFGRSACLIQLFGLVPEYSGSLGIEEHNA